MSGGIMPIGPMVIIDRAGAFEKSKVEEWILASIADNVLRFCDDRKYTFSSFRVSGGAVISPVFTRGNILEDTRYDGEGEIAEDLKERAVQLASEPLAAAYEKIFKEQDKVSDKEDKKLVEKWSLMLLYPDRKALYPDQKWGIGTTLLWTMRAIYHTAMAVIFEYGLWILYEVDLLNEGTYQDWRKANVADRLAEVIVQYQGMKYNYSRPETIENRLWKSISQTSNASS